MPKYRAFLISKDYKNNNVVGFHIIEDTNEMKKSYIPNNPQLFKNLVDSGKAEIIGLKYEKGSLVGSNGSLDRYASVEDGVLKGESPLVILKQLGNLGYRVSDWKGTVQNLKTNEVVEYAKRKGIANGKLMPDNNGGMYISSIVGGYDFIEVKAKAEEEKITARDINDNLKNIEYAKKIVELSDDKNSGVVYTGKDKSKDLKKLEESEQQLRELKEKELEIRKQRDRQFLGTLGKEYTLLYKPAVGSSNMTDESTGMTSEQKMVACLNSIKRARPFYSAMLRVIDKSEVDQSCVPTMGVTHNKLFYCPEFVRDTSLPELAFVLVHEASHIAMMHPTRVKGRNPKVWNIACDLFINKALVEDFGLTVDLDLDIFETTQFRGDNTKIGMKFPRGGLYSPLIDTNNDVVESIYEELIKENKDLEEKLRKHSENKEKEKSEDKDDSASDGDGKKEKGDGEEKGKGDASGEDQSDGTGEGDGQSDSSGESQGEGQGEGQGQTGKGEGKGNGTGIGNGKGDKENAKGQGANSNGQDSSEYGPGLADKDGAKGTKNTGTKEKMNGKPEKNDGSDGGNVGNDDINFRGKRVGSIDDVESDMINDRNDSHKTDREKEMENRSAVSRGEQLSKMDGGDNYSKTGTSILERLVKEALAPKINWKQILKSKLTLRNGTYASYSSPDKRFISRKNVLPGPRKAEPNGIDGIKLCIDTSGSISDEDLAIALNQIMQMFKLFRVKADLLYWDVDVHVDTPFKDTKEMMRIKPKGGGGTDVNCVFRSFETRDYKNGRRVPAKLVIIFTDGMFGAVEPRFKKYDTVWVISGDHNKFKAPFGIIAPFRTE